MSRNPWPVRRASRCSAAPVELRFTLCLIQPLMPSLDDGTRAQARIPSVNRVSSLVADPAVGNSTMLCDT
jgi:hypothetical protein